ncbi:endonuclease/exonuclease/phosphatase family protein [Colwellia sp. RSH04]|uniref:endonuclease/exonuclease/phosphatase family protein n=1 Tax=Colwellia sp. RSH04 TaxID=2305464 RepID=UPI000E57FADF|nr:endonuclease/exonuclease/phosphatase family protein [Colwellia sp. RSH04]RHW75257.1 hypothetical protein D1094_14115 [Colwellia sp. RSH04]
MKKSILTTIALSAGLFMNTAVLAEDLKVASWNIAWLGSHEYNERHSDDYKALAKYASTLNADVIALQEVESEYWAKKVFGDNYNYYFSTKDWVQRVGVAIRKDIGLTVKASEYKALDVGRVRHGMDITLSRNGKTTSLLAVHLKSGCFAKSLDKSTVADMPSSTEKEEKKKLACQLLSKQKTPLSQWIDNKQSQGEAFIILGDFNRRFSQDIANDFSHEQGLWQAINDDKKQQLWTPTASKNSDCWGGYYKDYIDHIVFNPEAKKHYIDNSFNQLVFKEKYTRKLSQTLSDHCPISVTLDF